MRAQNLRNARQAANEHRRVLAVGRWLKLNVFLLWLFFDSINSANSDLIFRKKKRVGF